LADFQKDNQTGFGWFVFTSDNHPKKSVWGLSMEWVSRGAGVEWDFNGGKLDKSGWLSYSHEGFETLLWLIIAWLHKGIRSNDFFFFGGFWV
jgi:hypothetical protein